MTGTVKWFNAAKGYGFIERADKGGDVFVHFSGIDGKGYRQLMPNDKVEFEIVDTDKGKQAVKVCVLIRVEPAPGEQNVSGV